jgi:hypothetical protein
MNIQLQCKQSAAGSFSPANTIRREAGDSSAKLLVTVTFLAVVVAFLYGAFSVAFRVIHSARENLRATQIVMQKAEALRLFTWSQVCDSNNSRKPLFVEPQDSLGAAQNRGGEQYAGYLTAAAPAAGDLANASRSHMRPVTVTLCWTNYHGAQPVVHTRELQTRLARNGTPKYIWGAL